MEKEMNEKKKQKNITKKAKKIRSIVMMSLLCVLMLSAATYAWFTLSNTAKITQLTMTVGETSGLQISATGDDGTFTGSIPFDEIEGKLKPATTPDGINFKAPDYNEDGEVVDLKATTVKLPQSNANEDTEGYYIEYSFWLLSGKNSTVRLATGSGMNNGFETTDENYSGTYILSKLTNDTKKVPGSAAVRISFTDDDGNTVVYEPNNGITNPTGINEGFDYAKENIPSGKNITAVTSGIIHGATGQVVTVDNVKKNDPIISLTGGEKAKITMRIWIEGKDAQCVNQIAAKDIVGQLMFTNAEETTTDAGE